MKKSTGNMMAGLACLLAATVQAQLPVGSHYPASAEGIKGSVMPPPGFYLRDYNFSTPPTR